MLRAPEFNSVQEWSDDPETQEQLLTAARLAVRLGKLKNDPDPDAKLVIHREEAATLGWNLFMLMMQAATRDSIARKYEEQERRAFDALAEAGSKRERLERAARVMGWLKDDGELVLTRGGYRRAALVSHYLWKIRVDKMSTAEAADQVQAAAGFPSRKALRSFLERADIEIREDPNAEERKLPGILLDESGCSTPWPRVPQIPIPPEQ